MNNKLLIPLLFMSLFSFGSAVADTGKITITTPANNATVTPHDNVVLSYTAVPGPEGDHLHLYLDGKRIDVIHMMKGDAEVGMLNPGKHNICLEVNTKGHVSTGVKACVDVASK